MEEEEVDGRCRGMCDCHGVVNLVMLVPVPLTSPLPVSRRGWGAGGRRW